MKKIVIIGSSIFLVGIILSQSGVLNSLLIFLLVGAVPGTSINLSPNMMLLVGAAILWAILVNLTIVKLTDFVSTKRSRAKHVSPRSRLPKRRYSRI